MTAGHRAGLSMRGEALLKRHLSFTPKGSLGAGLKAGKALLQLQLHGLCDRLPFPETWCQDFGLGISHVGYVILNLQLSYTRRMFLRKLIFCLLSHEGLFLNMAKYERRLNHEPKSKVWTLMYWTSNLTSFFNWNTPPPFLNNLVKH